MDTQTSNSLTPPPADNLPEPKPTTWQERNAEADTALDEVLRNSGLAVKPVKLFPATLNWTAQMF